VKTHRGLSAWSKGEKGLREGPLPAELRKLHGKKGREDGKYIGRGSISVTRMRQRLRDRHVLQDAREK